MTTHPTTAHPPPHLHLNNNGLSPATTRHCPPPQHMAFNLPQILFRSLRHCRAPLTHHRPRIPRLPRRHSPLACTNPHFHPPSSSPPSTSTSTPVPTYCPRCATPLDLRIPPQDNLLRKVCPSCHYILYENPKLVVGTVPLSRDLNRVLLVKRAIPPIGKWTIPAGFLELHETTEQGAVREAWEEAGVLLDINPLRLVAVYNILVAGQVQMLYAASVLNENDIKPGVESLEVKMFLWDDIPWQNLAFPTVTWALEYVRDNRGKARILPHIKSR